MLINQKAEYKLGDVSKVAESPCQFVEKSELYAIIMVLSDLQESLNIITDSQYAESCFTLRDC